MDSVKPFCAECGCHHNKGENTLCPLTIAAQEKKMNKLSWRDKIDIGFRLLIMLVWSTQVDLFYAFGLSIFCQHYFHWNWKTIFLGFLVIWIVFKIHIINKAYKEYKLEQLQKKVISGINDLKNEILSKTLNHNETKPS